MLKYTDFWKASIDNKLISISVKGEKTGFTIDGIKILLRTLILVGLILFFKSSSFAQDYTQNIKGQIFDKENQQVIPGAIISVLGSVPLQVTTSDEKGYFIIQGVQMGRISIQISYLGYRTIILDNLYVATGKELNLHLELEEQVHEIEKVTVTAQKSKANPNNDMAMVSARSFTVEETERYAGSRGDVARMAENYAGVSYANDSRNDIVIRGNSPAGLLWRLEDVDVPNPNHFAENGTTGGPVSMLNNNVLRNSDFLTGAFPAEYGNALSGVFDLKMRNGNCDKFEFLGQVGFNGFELGAEGPFSKDDKSSFLINYRYSTLELMSKMGINFGASGVPNYQDLNFKLVFPVNKGLITIFGLAGQSQIAMLDSKLSGNNLYTSPGENLYNGSEMATMGISYTRYLSKRTYAKVILSALYQWGWTHIDTLNPQKLPLSIFNYYNESITESRASLYLITGTKINSHLTVRSGMTIDQMAYHLYMNVLNENTKQLSSDLDNSKTLLTGPQLFRAYNEWNYKVNDYFMLSPGVHLMYFDLNKQISVEPRMAIKWKYTTDKSISLGYGLLSKTQTLATYYLETFDSQNNKILETNKSLGFTKSSQFVLGHDWNLGNFMRLKTEMYYQYLFDVPIESKLSYYSVLNEGAYWGVQTNDSLVNKGTGENYGIEITFEKFYGQGYYFLLTGSLFNSTYKGSNRIKTNSAYDGNYVCNVLVGKEVSTSKNTTFNFDLKFAYAGGIRYTPIDTLHSTILTINYIQSETFAKQFPSYFKADIKVGFKLNGKRISQEWQAYVENFTNHQNVLEQTYSSLTPGKIQNTYQLGFFPMFLYRLNF